MGGNGNDRSIHGDYWVYGFNYVCRFNSNLELKK